MNMKILRGTVFGGIAYFLLGWVVYGIILNDFRLTNFNQCASRASTEMVWWAMIVSSFVNALLITIILKWAGAKGIADGLKTGAVFGLLLALGMDLSGYSMTTMFNNFTAIIIDVVVSTVMTAAIAMIIVLFWGKEKP